MRFSCVGCGKCCNDHHVPLTLDEAVQWAVDGGQLIVLTEGFLEDERLALDPALQHAQRRSLRVPCGSTHAHVAVTFAAFNVGPCRNLDENLMCRIYDRRPLVCRIYPAEINPHIPLRAEHKDCPPQAWEQGPVLMHDGKPVALELEQLIERSRQADRDDIAAKAAICKLLGIRTMALKGEGFTAFLPDMGHFVQAAGRVAQLGLAASAGAQPWSLLAPDEALIARLEETGAMIEAALEQQNSTYIPLRKAG
jgi:Fe-S-cluster containining protein